MRAAPAVDAALGSGRVERVLITLLHAVAGAAFSVWAAAHAEAVAGPFFAGLAGLAWLTWLMGSVGALGLGLVGCWLARQALPAEPARLRWDGSSWQLGREWRDDDLVPLQRVVVAMDLGAWMLLQLVPAEVEPSAQSAAQRAAQQAGKRSDWRVASAQGVGGAWHGLRVALQAHAGAPLGTDGGETDPMAKGPGTRP
jgi:hypothetical protein